MRGTILNTTTVLIGGGAGLAIGHFLPVQDQGIALHGIGLVVIGVGLKMFLAGKNPVIAAASISLGGILGGSLNLQGGVEKLANFLQNLTGGHAGFASGMITSFVLFCVGPMTILGCTQDALENKIDILSLKSTMDGISAFFIAAATGAGVLITGILLFMFQGMLTLLARPAKKLVSEPHLMDEISCVGGALLIGTGLGLLEIKDLQTMNYLPALIIAPLLSHVVHIQLLKKNLLAGSEASSGLTPS